MDGATSADQITRLRGMRLPDLRRWLPRTTAARINVMFLSAALLFSAVVIVYTAQQVYRVRLDALVASLEAHLVSRPDLQLQIYQRDQPSLRRTLEAILQPPAASAGFVTDGLGETLASVGADSRMPPFRVLRRDLSVADFRLVSVDEDGDPAGTGWWSALLDPEAPLYLTAPIFTSVNSGISGLDIDDFSRSLLTPPTGKSLRVIGYANLGVDRNALLSQIRPEVRRVAYGCLLFLLVLGGVTIYLTRRLSRTIARLGTIAEELAMGKHTRPVGIDGGEDIQHFVAVLNHVIGGFSNSQKENDVGHKLLSMKVEERTSQLSRRDEELQQAAREITQTRSQLERMARYDSLTSLPNRRLLSEQLGQLLDANRPGGRLLGLLFLNLDKFKRINESLGHAAGDLLLRQVGKRLAESVRGGGRVMGEDDPDAWIGVSRFGGDEFTVVLDQLDRPEAAGLVAQRLLDALAEPIAVEDQEVVVSASIGIAVAPQDGAEAADLLRAAQIAMHHAKASAREGYLYFRQDMAGAGSGRLRLEADLRRALEREELRLHYQPQVSMTNGSVVGVEALLRWEHPEQGFVPPAVFIRLAEEIGIIDALGDWVLVEACRQLREFREQGLNLPRIGINVSGLQLDAAFTRRVEALLVEHALEPGQLDLGLSESVLQDEGTDTSACLHELGEMGVHLSIDDFGIACTPLYALGRLSEIKIDRRFSAECRDDEEGARLVGAIITMADKLGLRVVAEGVETEEQFRLLVGCGAKVMQGYLFGEPMPVEDLRPLLAPWHFMDQIQRMEQ